VVKKENAVKFRRTSGRKEADKIDIRRKNNKIGEQSPICFNSSV